MVQTKFSDHDEGESFDYKKNNWKALIGTNFPIYTNAKKCIITIGTVASAIPSNSFFEIPIMSLSV
jgi:hypothetical protein